MKKFISDCRDGRSAGVRFRQIFMARLKEGGGEEEISAGLEDVVDAFTLGFNMGLSNRFPSSINRKAGDRMVLKMVEKDVKSDISPLVLDLSSMEGFIKDFGCLPVRPENNDSGHLLPASIFYAGYKKYCKGNSISKFSNIKFSEFIKKSGFEKKRTARGFVYFIYLPDARSCSKFRKIIEL